TGAPEVLGELAAPGLAATPAFAFVEPADDGMRVIVRGAARVTVGHELVDGSRAATWLERVVDAGPVALEAGAQAAPSADAPPALPIERGVVRAVRLSGVEAGAAITAGAPTAPPATVEPAPATVDPAPETTIVHTELDAAIPTAPEPVVATPDADEVDGYDFLFGATVYRPVSEAAVAAPEAADGAAGDRAATAASDEQGGASDPDSGDHDGETIMVEKLNRMRRRGSSTPADAVEPVAASAAEPSPALILVLDADRTEVIDGPLVLGRSPSVSGVPAGVLPRLVAIPDTEHDLSRSHLHVDLQGGTVVITDLHSKNGTTVTLPGAAPVRLRAGEPTPVIPGTTVELGGVTSITVEER
ncbi:MAG TPA: FHA domain-containing protein, partial [Microcella sp.]|nr:FHA domain-containing protein [Microcella sp.]